MPIQILPEEVASQIAAGEVVERPASVVKELLENSLDAGAKVVTITIEEAGKRFIEVADDGNGIPKDELALAVARHATSKLRSAKDLFMIGTLGFRGEALASIGSVSRMTLTSCESGNDQGARLRVEGGHLQPVHAIGAPPGTVIKVEDLFFNVPARLKFLKTNPTERRHIDALVTRYAMAYPDCRILLRQDGKVVLQTSGNGNAREVLGALYGADIARKMLEVNAVYDSLKMTGFISPTSLTRSNRKEITLFINGRWVQDAALTTALIQAYHTLLMVGRYPMALLFLELPPEIVDVNVHPAKAEVRFRDQGQVFADVQRAVRRALLAHTPVPEVNTQLQWTPRPVSKPDAQPQIPTAWERVELKQPSSHSNVLPGMVPKAEDVPDIQQKSLPVERMPLLRLVGQLAGAYIIAEGPDGLYLIDQHAAHERVLFEQFMQQQLDEIPSQVLLEPLAVELPAHQANLIEEQLPVLGRLGFQVEEFGRNTFLLRSLPVLLTGLEPEAALRVLVEDFEEDETPLQSRIEAKIIGRVCKRAAVKAGQVLSRDEQQKLLHSLEQCENPRTCPHGRPTMIHLSVDLLERQFGRKGAR